MSIKIKLSDIQLDKLNPNKATEESDYLLTKSMQKFGNRAAVVLDKNNAILDGNKRILKHGELEIGDDVVIIQGDPSKQYAIKFNDIDLNTKEGQELKLLLNTTSKKSQFDVEIIQEIAECYDVNVEECGVDIIHDENNDLKAKEDDFNIPEDIQTNIKYGDLFELIHNGITHRLQCGDSTKKEDVDRLLNGEFADMIFTDPPYEIQIDYSVIHQIIKNTNIFIFNNDRNIIEQLKNSPYKFCKFFIFTHNGCAIPQNGGNEAFLTHVLISHEISGNPQKYIKGDGLRTVINGEYRKSEFHPHEKPFNVINSIISSYSIEKNNIVDLFGGSGSTLMVCAQTNRRCFIQEFNPYNCQIILDRFKNKFKDSKINSISMC